MEIKELTEIKEIKEKIEQRFSKLEFEEARHIYSVEGKVYPSVSGLVKQHVEPFNEQGISYGYARKYNMTQAAVLAQWKETRDIAAREGTIAHLYGENYFYDKTLMPETKLEEAIYRYWAEMPQRYIPISAELQMYSEKLGYAGTADIIFWDTILQGLVIKDYKTNKDLFKNFKQKKMLGSFNQMLDNPLNKYQLQFSYYQILLEETGLPVVGRILIWIKRDGTYTVFNTDDYTKQLRQHLNAA